MCMCGKPTLNGEPGYSWNGEAKHVYPINAPDIGELDELLYDEPGRCGGGVGDSHCHHFRIVKARYGGFALLVRHGGGDERIELGYSRTGILNTLTTGDSNARYSFLSSLYYVIKDAMYRAASQSDDKWRRAAAEKRIKTRRLPKRGMVKVWVEPARAQA